MAITPFPISAHRTGGPDFRSPALRLASPQGTRRGSEWQAFEAQQTEFPIDSVVREPAGGAPLHFVPSCAESPHAALRVDGQNAGMPPRRPPATRQLPDPPTVDVPC